MKRIGILILFFQPLMLLCQAKVWVSFSTVEDYLFPKEAPFHYTLGDQVVLRESPSGNAKALKVLPIASPLMIYKQSDSTAVKKGITSHWYQVKSGTTLGWVWGGLIAQEAFRSKADNDIIFLCGYDKVMASTAETPRGVYYQIRAVKHQIEIGKIRVKSFARDFAEVSNIGNGGLKNVDDIITIRVPCYGGCGCLTGEVVVFWSNQKLYKVADLKGTPDAEYSEGTSFIFPSDLDGVKGMIIKQKCFPGEESLSDHTLERFIVNEYYVWDGKALIKLKRKTTQERYTIQL